MVCLDAIGDMRGRSLTKEHYVVQQPTVIVRRLFLLPCITEKDIATMETSLVEFCHLIKVTYELYSLAVPAQIDSHVDRVPVDSTFAI